MSAAFPPIVDARGVTVSLPAPPRRIVSLVPSTTETLFELGVGDRVVGVTRFCVHPREALAGRVRGGGTKDLELDRLATLDPDLVVANAEEISREMFAAIEGRWPLWVEDLVKAGFPRDKLRLVEGEACSWHGARMARSLAHLAASGEA